MAGSIFYPQEHNAHLLGFHLLQLVARLELSVGQQSRVHSVSKETPRDSSLTGARIMCESLRQRLRLLQCEWYNKHAYDMHRAVQCSYSRYAPEKQTRKVQKRTYPQLQLLSVRETRFAARRAAHKCQRELLAASLNAQLPSSPLCL